jgi:hypothetical protein
MPCYTFTDACGTREQDNLPDDEAAIAFARGWAAGGDYPEPTEIAVWHDERLVISFTHHATVPDDGQPDEAREWADFDPDC